MPIDSVRTTAQMVWACTFWVCSKRFQKNLLHHKSENKLFRLPVADLYTGSMCISSCLNSSYPLCSRFRTRSLRSCVQAWFNICGAAHNCKLFCSCCILTAEVPSTSGWYSDNQKDSQSSTWTARSQSYDVANTNAIFICSLRGSMLCHLRSSAGSTQWSHHSSTKGTSSGGQARTQAVPAFGPKPDRGRTWAKTPNRITCESIWFARKIRQKQANYRTPSLAAHLTARRAKTLRHAMWL